MSMAQFKLCKFLTHSDITDKLPLPTQIMVHVPINNGSHFVDLEVIDSVEQAWQLRYYTRPRGKRPSPVFTCGWRRFVRAKGLQVGDKLMFYGHQLVDSNGGVRMQYRIQVSRMSNVTYQGEPVYLDDENFLSF